MNPWHDIAPERITSDKFVSVIEIPKGSKKKYELDKETGMLILDRILSTSTHYPENYGFIPLTLADDNDPLDVLVICEDKLNPISLVECRAIGVLKMTDNNEIDEKIVAVPVSDNILGNCTDVSELSKHQFSRIRHFFEVYKYLENKQTKVGEVYSADEAKRIIEESMDNYRKKFADNKN